MGSILFVDIYGGEMTPGFTKSECFQFFHVFTWLFQCYIDVIPGPTICIYVVNNVFRVSAGRNGDFPAHPF